jgi:hypothetical protein
MERLPGVESATVSLNEGRAVLRLKPDNALTLPEIRRSVERNGFTPRQAIVRARARVIATAGRLQVRILGTSDAYEVAATPHASEIQRRLHTLGGSDVIVDGVVPAPKDRKAPAVIQVTAVEPDARR